MSAAAQPRREGRPDWVLVSIAAVDAACGLLRAGTIASRLALQMQLAETEPAGRA